MKHFFTISLCFLALSLSAQTDGWEYPFPYNPDGDADGYVTLSDLLDLLALYGNEYPDSFHYDDSGAILYLGQLSLHDCYNQARAAEGNWRLPNTKDILKWGDYLIQQFDLFDAQVHPNGSNYGRDYLMWGYDNAENNSLLEIEYYKYGNSDGIINHNGSSVRLVGAVMAQNDHCYIVTEVRAEIDYKCIESSSFETDSQELINQGYFPVGGPTYINNGWVYGCFWKYADQ